MLIFYVINDLKISLILSFRGKLTLWPLRVTSP